ncbi:MAG: hypothetical protein ACRELG_00865 [Gemmataceae bacterium]
MARGWGKNPEEVAEPAGEAEAGSKPGLSPAQAARARTRQLLQLKRERILSERTGNPIRRAALEAALAEIEGELQHLG